MSVLYGQTGRPGFGGCDTYLKSEFRRVHGLVLLSLRASDERGEGFGGAWKVPVFPGQNDRVRHAPRRDRVACFAEVVDDFNQVVATDFLKKRAGWFARTQIEPQIYRPVLFRPEAPCVIVKLGRRDSQIKENTARRDAEFF